jgi:alpha-galactosidase
VAPLPQLDETGGPALVLGWLAQRRQFGVVAADSELKRFQMHCSCHGQLLVDGVTDPVSTDWACAQLVSAHYYDEEPMAGYLHAVAGHNQARPLQNGSLLTGWCSWYFAYEKISSRLLRDNFAKLAGLKSIIPTNVSVVDDGYMLAWGDWYVCEQRL